MNRIQGLIAAAYTPMDGQRMVNLSMIKPYANYLYQSGAAGVFINGTTGEWASLTVQERLNIAEEWKRSAPEDFKLIVHVGCNSVEDSRIMAGHARQLGVDGIGMISPSFFKPGSVEELVSVCAWVADTAPDLPFYYYNMPSITGVNLPMIDFLKRAEQSIPTLQGIKYTHEDLMDMALCLHYRDQHFDILHGRDEMLLSGLILGVKGAVGSTYNYSAPLFNRLIEAFNAGEHDVARDLQIKACEIIKVLIKYGGGVKGGKYFMKQLGLDLGPLRLPFTSFDTDTELKMKGALQSVGFFDHFLMAETVV